MQDASDSIEVKRHRSPSGRQNAQATHWDLPAAAFVPASPTKELVLPQNAFECYFLLGAQGEWLRLWPHSRYTVGSSPACELMVDEPEISSRHALMEFRNARFHLCDLSSATGTFVDDLPIYDHPLTNGDCIRFGPRVFRFMAGEEKQLIAELMGLQGERAFSGNLSDTPLVDVLQFLHSTRKSGALSLVADGEMGAVELVDGGIVYAEISSAEGVPAIHRMLELKSGRFVFCCNSGTRVFRRNITVSMPFLLLDAARKLDESKPRL